MDIRFVALGEQQQEAKSHAAVPLIDQQHVNALPTQTLPIDSSIGRLYHKKS
jgi:hypothetical protein